MQHEAQPTVEEVQQQCEEWRRKKGRVTEFQKHYGMPPFLYQGIILLIR
jgi:hypothetical protein